MGFRLRHGLNAVMAVGVAVACNTYTSDLLLDEDSAVDSSDTTDSTVTGDSGGSSNDITTTLTSGTSSNASTSTNAGGDGGSGGGSGDSGGSGGAGTTGSASDTTSAGGSGGSDVNTTTTSTDTATTTTTGGGDGGNGGTGGTGGTSSTTGTPIDVALIDDLEDGDNQIERPTYSGYWFTTVDETGSGTVAPDPGEKCEPVLLDMPRDGSGHAMHVSGTWTGGNVWIAAVGFALQDDETPVDASSYEGVSFYARTDEEDTQVRLLVMITDVVDEAHYEIELTLTNSWELFQVEWDDPRLIQPSWANEVDFDPAHLWKLQFQFDTEDFDLWVDDIRFMEP